VEKVLDNTSMSTENLGELYYCGLRST